MYVIELKPGNYVVMSLKLNLLLAYQIYAVSNLKTVFSLSKRIKCFPSTLRQMSLKTQQSVVILDFCLRKSQEGKSRDYHFRKTLFSTRFRSQTNEKTEFSNSFRLESISEKLRLRDGLAWTGL